MKRYTVSVTPSHTSLMYGISISHSVSPALELGINLALISSTNVSLMDPIDHEVVSVDTIPTIIIEIMGRYHLNSKKISPFLALGAGLNLLNSSGTKSYLSDWGNRIELLPPEDNTALSLQLGIGFTFWLVKKGGIEVEGFYRLINRDDTIQSLNLTMGIFWRF